jgi:predicted RNA-binding protein with PIN domain
MRNRGPLPWLSLLYLVVLLRPHKYTSSSFVLVPTVNEVRRFQQRNPSHFELFARKKGGSKQALENLSLQIQKKLKLDATTTDGTTILLVDSNNIRGSDGFKFTTEDLIKSLASWRRHTGMPTQNLVCVMDHGCRSNSFVYDGITLVFAGPNRTADDVIAHDCQWFTNATATDDSNKCHVFVVTNDRELRSRCKRASGDTKAVQVFSSDHLVKILKRHWEEAIRLASTFNVTRTRESTTILDDLRQVESDIRNYDRPPLNNRRERRKAQAQKTAHGRKSILSEIQMDAEAKEENILDIADDALRPLGTLDFCERTWHRVLIAERLRAILQEEASKKESTEEVEEALEIISRYQATHNSFTGDPVDILYNQRIRHDLKAKESLLRYLELSEASKDQLSETSAVH